MKMRVQFHSFAAITIAALMVTPADAQKTRGGVIVREETDKGSAVLSVNESVPQSDDYGIYGDGPTSPERYSGTLYSVTPYYVTPFYVPPYQALPGYLPYFGSPLWEARDPGVLYRRLP
jgi:hypothetical protein